MNRYISYIFILIPIIGIWFFGPFESRLEGDEPRYLSYAENLLNGYFTNGKNPVLTNGPGYPIFLALLLLLKVPIILMKKLNLFFLFGTIACFYLTLKRTIKDNTKALLLTLVFEYFLLSSNNEYLKLLTEPITLFLVSALTLFFVSDFRWKNWITGLFLGYLILVKVVFAYVVILLFILYLFWYFIKNEKKYSPKILVTLLIAILSNLPYLAYTFSLTGKLLFWSDHGGKTLYWLTSPYKYEYGDWIPLNLLPTNTNPLVKFDTGYIKNNHKEYVEILKLSSAEQDAVFKKTAISQIIKHPTKFLSNWQCNVSRLFFNRPYTFRLESNQNNSFLFIEIPSALFISLLLVLLFKFFNNQLSQDCVFIFLMGLVYLLFSSVSYASFRQFYIITPVFYALFSPVIIGFQKYIKESL